VDVTARYAAQAQRLICMSGLLRRIFLVAIVNAIAAPVFATETFPTYGPVVPGSKAVLHFGRALAPADAPLSVKRAIWAGNQLRWKPYRYGGGHKTFFDKSYDCSGTVSYVLAAAGLMQKPICSDELRSFGQPGKGKWITVYARDGHAYAVIAGLRLDTTEWNETKPNRHWAPRWRTSYREPRHFKARHPEGL
jgi:hypothetical protein